MSFATTARPNDVGDTLILGEVVFRFRILDGDGNPVDDSGAGGSASPSP